jgi:hypothetical protein
MVLLACLTAMFAGCAGWNKLTVPLAEIDRPLIDPTGTWSTSPQIGYHIISEDTITYRSVDLAGWFVASYSLTNNLSLPFIPLPYLTWQLTKSALADTTRRYKWQFAVGGGITAFSQASISGRVRLDWKKRISPSVWYSGHLSDGGTDQWGPPQLRLIYKYVEFSNGIGFQLSSKASVATAASVTYWTEPMSHPSIYYTGGTSLSFQYRFTPYFGINAGSVITVFQHYYTGVNTFVGTTFFW